MCDVVERKLESVEKAELCRDGVHGGSNEEEKVMRFFDEVEGLRLNDIHTIHLERLHLVFLNQKPRSKGADAMRPYFMHVFHRLQLVRNKDIRTPSREGHRFSRLCNMDNYRDKVLRVIMASP